MRPNAGENGQISPSTTIRAARGAGSRPHLASAFQGSRKSAAVHASSGVIWGIPGQSSMPAAIAFLRNRVGFTATVEGRFSAVLAAIHFAAFAIMLWSEVDVVAKTTFVLAWGFLNFFWLAVLRRPGLSAALSLVMLIVLILLSRFKHELLFLTASFVVVMLCDFATFAFLFTV